MCLFCATRLNPDNACYFFCTSLGHVNASLWAVAFLQALRGWGHQWSLAPPQTCAQFQIHPGCTCPNKEERDLNIMWKCLVVSVCVWEVGSRFTVNGESRQIFQKGNTLSLFWFLGCHSLCNRLNKRYVWMKNYLRSLSLNSPSQHMALNP